MVKPIINIGPVRTTKVKGILMWQVIPELAFLTENGTDAVSKFLSLFVRIQSCNRYFPGIGVQDSRNQLDGCRFPGSIGSDKGQDFPLCYAKREILYSLDALVMGGEKALQGAAKSRLLDFCSELFLQVANRNTRLLSVITNAAESCNQMSRAVSIDCDGSFQLRWTDIFVKKTKTWDLIAYGDHTPFSWG